MVEAGRSRAAGRSPFVLDTHELSQLNAEKILSFGKVFSEHGR